MHRMRRVCAAYAQTSRQRGDRKQYKQGDNRSGDASGQWVEHTGRIVSGHFGECFDTVGLSSGRLVRIALARVRTKVSGIRV
jgi:hypothetical protein